MIGRYESEQRQRERREAAARQGTACRPPGQRTTSRPTTLTDTMTALLNVVLCRATLPDLEEWRCCRCIPLPKDPSPNTLHTIPPHQPAALWTQAPGEGPEQAADTLGGVQRAARPPGRRGFRPNHHCAEQVLTLREIVDRRKQYRLDTWIWFVDFAKAYNSVPQTTIMPNCGISGCVEHSSTYWLNSPGRPRSESKWGLGQGCPLSPILFNVYVADLLTPIEKIGVPIPTTGMRIPGLIYADDLVLLTDTEDQLRDLRNSSSQLELHLGHEGEPTKNVESYGAGEVGLDSVSVDDSGAPSAPCSSTCQCRMERVTEGGHCSLR